jgi:hypothetical protein
MKERAYQELKAAALALYTDFSVAARLRLSRAWAAYRPFEA